MTISAPLRVAIVAPGPRTQGGITEVVRSMLDALDGRQDVQASWIATHRTGSRAAKLGQLLSSVFRAVRTFPAVDVVHIHASAWISCLRKSIFFWLARLLGKPVVWHLHAGSDEFSELFERPGLLARYARGVIDRADLVVVLTDSWRRRVAAYLGRDDRIRVLRNPAPAPVQGSVRKPREPRILYLGRLFPRKGHDDLLRGFAEIAQMHPAARVVFAGSGDIANTRALAELLGVADRVEFLGWITGERKAAELARAAIFALPSHQEASPVSILEAMSAGTPVVATNVGGIPDVVHDGITGLLVEPRNPVMLGRALNALLDDPALGMQLAERAAAAMESRTASMIAEEWVAAYRDVAAHRSGDCRSSSPTLGKGQTRP
jgi:glycosyltransferase involved in cell wall biosynthesis